MSWHSDWLADQAQTAADLSGPEESPRLRQDRIERERAMSMEMGRDVEPPEKVEVPCRKCGGSGGGRGRYQCSECGGRGYVLELAPLEEDTYHRPNPEHDSSGGWLSPEEDDDGDV